MTQQMPSLPSADGVATMTAFAVYVLYLVAALFVVAAFVGFAAVIGVIVAYINNGGAPA